MSLAKGEGKNRMGSQVSQIRRSGPDLFHSFPFMNIPEFAVPPIQLYIFQRVDVCGNAATLDQGDHRPGLHQFVVHFLDDGRPCKNACR